MTGYCIEITRYLRLRLILCVYSISESTLLMKKLIFTFALLFVGLSAFSQTDWRAELQKETVTIEDGKYNTTEFQLLKFQNGGSLQMEITSSATLGTMNRDNFITIHTTLGLFTIFGILNELGFTLDDVDFEDLDEAIGTPDLRLLFTMTKNGIQIVITTEDGTERETMTWEEFFADN